ncbi:hypothetical protein, partial [Raoultella planticola]
GRRRFAPFPAASFGWKVCLPLTLINLLVTAAVILWQAQ